MIAADPHAPDRVARARVHAALGEPVRLAIVESLLLGDLAPDQLASDLGLPGNLLAHHLNVLDDAGLIARSVSAGDRRRRYLRLIPSVLDGLVSAPRLRARSVLFVCTANSARSQLAAALWRQRSTVPAESAGHQPAERIARGAATIAARHGLQLADRPRGYDQVMPPDLVVSVCDRAREAAVPFDAPQLHWSVADPAGRGASAFRAAFDELSRRVDGLAAHVDAA